MWNGLQKISMRRAALLAALALTALSRPLPAQTPAGGPAARLEFEVASIKLNKSGDRRNRRISTPPGGRFEVINLPLRTLIRLAYPIQTFQIVGGPGWMDSDMFDVSARIDVRSLTASGMLPKESQQQMMRALLADRFKLRVHMEQHTLPYFALVMARPDNSLGPKLSRAQLDCDALIDKGGPFPPEMMQRPEPGKSPVCGGLDGIGHLGGFGRPLRALATSLTVWVERVVVDETGQSGTFNWDLQWIPDQQRRFDAVGGPSEPDQQVQLNGTSVFTPLEEQLGLKLESRRGPVDVLVIDRAEQPTPD